MPMPKSLPSLISSLSAISANHTMYAIICFDRPDSATLRDQHRAAHLDFLKKHSARVVFGGPLKINPEGPSTGALIVVDCASRKEAEALIGADPFNRAGVYESVAVRAFKQVFPPK
jgi:uncharacterized protein